jgi:hypothetical protein
VTGIIGIVQIGHPGPTDDADDAYWRTGRGAQLSSMYGSLLGMEPIYIGYHKLVHPDGRTPEIGFEHAPDDAPPQWPDPARPAQVHLDISVEDLDGASRLVVSHGATLLHDFGDHRVLADPVGHPFCLVPGGGPARIVRIVFDCANPRSMAAFFEQLLDLRARVLDTPERVELRGEGHDVSLAFQHSPGPAPTWPDPTHPAQLHLDIAFDDGADVPERIERLGGTRRILPERPDHLVYADPGGHPFCVGLDGWGTSGPAQVAEYEAWLASAPEAAE